MAIPSVAIQGGIPQRRAVSGGSFFDEGFDPFSLFHGLEQLKPFAAPTQEVILNVQPPKGEVNPWLPAQSLSIQEIWSDSQRLQEGEVFTRSFIIEAEGIHSSQLPSLEGLQTQGEDFKVYADKPELKDEIKNGKLKSSRKEQYTFIPEKSGRLTLPEITVAWWDVVNQKSRLSNVPARPVTIAPEEKVASNRQKASAIKTPEKESMPIQSDLIQNPILYSVIAGLAVLLLGTVLCLVLLQRKMARMLEIPQKKNEKVVLNVLINKPNEHKKELASMTSKKREKLDDLNPT